MGCPLSHEQDSPVDDVQIRNANSPITERVYERRGGEPFVHGEISGDQNGCPDVVPSRETYRQSNRHSEGPAEVLPAVHRDSLNGYNIEATKRERSIVEDQEINTVSIGLGDVTTKPALPYTKLDSLSEEDSASSIEHRIQCNGDEDEHRNVTCLADELRQSMNLGSIQACSEQGASMYDEPFVDDDSVECDDDLVVSPVGTQGKSDCGTTAESCAKVAEVGQMGEPFDSSGTDGTENCGTHEQVHTAGVGILKMENPRLVGNSEDLSDRLVDCAIDGIESLGNDGGCFGVESGTDVVERQLGSETDTMGILTERNAKSGHMKASSDNDAPLAGSLIDVGIGESETKVSDAVIFENVAVKERSLLKENSCTSFVNEYTPTSSDIDRSRCLVTQSENLILFSEDEDSSRHLEEEGIDPAKHGAQMEDRFYNNKAFKEPDVDPADPQQQDAAKAIQTKYRQHQAKQLVEGLREEQAAVRIQAGYRGFKDRERVLEMRDPDEYNRRVAVREARIAARGMRPTDSALAAVSGDAEEEVDIDLTDPDVEQAAIKIQAGFKGFKARQEVQKMKGESDTQASEGTVQEAPLEQAPPGSSEPQKQEDEEVDIDLNDPDVQQATLKIQAGFKGMKARKQVKEMKEVNAAADETPSAEESKPAEETKPVEETKSEEQAKPEEPKEEEEIDIDLNDPKVADATVKIQAGFKGMKARKEVKEKRSLIESQKSGTGPSEVAGEGEGSTDKVAEETEPTTTQSTEEAEPTTTQSTEEAEPTTTQSTEQVEPTTTQSTEEAKPTSEKAEEEAEPTAENTTEEAEPTEEKPQGDEQS